MLRLPPEGHPVRTLLDTAEIVALTSQSALTLPTIPQARKIARERLKDAPTVKAPQYSNALKVCNLLVVAEDGRVALVGFGARGSYKVRWYFGYPKVPPAPYVDSGNDEPEPREDVLEIPRFLRRGTD